MSIARSPSFDSVPTSARSAGRELRAAAANAWRGLRCALPQTCTLCAARCGDALVCTACTRALPYLPPACPVCALPTLGAAVCGTCLTHPPPFAATVAPLVYAFPVDRLLQAMKYRARLALADWAAAELAQAVQRASASRDRARVPDCIVALPLAAQRQRERGFNQAQEIARRVACSLGLPQADVLVRTRAAAPQADLPWTERARNIRGVFACCRDVRARHPVLVDDVMTTGATLAEAAATLVRAGAASVQCWVVARTLPPGQR